MDAKELVVKPEYTQCYKFVGKPCHAFLMAGLWLIDNFGSLRQVLHSVSVLTDDPDEWQVLIYIYISADVPGSSIPVG